MLVQLGTPAVVAGVPDIAVVVPPVPGSAGEVDPAVLVVAEELGIYEVFRANGPAGIAALAFGTETVPKVRKVVGPGSPAVDVRPGRGPALRDGHDHAARAEREPHHRRRQRRPPAAGRRPAERGRARPRLLEPARHRQRGPVGGGPG